MLTEVRLTPGTGGGGRFDSAHGTHASFGARGDRVIVTYHGDHAYSFDVTAAGGERGGSLLWQQPRLQVMLETLSLRCTGLASPVSDGLSEQPDPGDSVSRWLP